MEANFSLFFGLAIQLYEATLVADDSKYDRVQEGLATFTEAEEDGLTTFEGAGKCDTCHTPPEFTNHTSREVRAGKPADPLKGFIAANAFERMNMAERKAFYDTGIYNISVTRTTDDIGRGGAAPNEPDFQDLNGNALPLSFSKLAILKAVEVLPDTVERFTPGLSDKDAREDLLSDPEESRTAVDGAFKTPSLRNVELTGPYFHNGGAATLKQVVEFYTRGGNFPKTNIGDLDPEIDEIGRLRGDEEKQNSLVAFLLTLTDERVKFERAPFDHPQLFVPSGSGVNENEGQPSAANENFIHIPAVGAKGRSEPLTTFLALPPTDPGFVTKTP
jgi:cytochrome c peroxidase